MNQFFSDPQTCVRLQVGPLGAYLEPYAARLHAQQFTRASARDQIRLVAHFSRWLDPRQVTAGQVTPQHAQDYLRLRTRQGTRRINGAAAALTRRLDLLRATAIIAAPPDQAVPTPAARVVGEFDRYVQHERGLAVATRICYRAFVSKFLIERFAAGPVELSCLCAADVTAFVQRHAAHPARKRAQLMTTALRAFLRFARQRGDITLDLAAAVPAVATWTFSTLPRGLPPAHVQRVLAHCDQETAVGRREFAILLLLARLGVRAGEVAALTLEDLDWPAGHLTVVGNRNREPLAGRSRTPVTESQSSAGCDHHPRPPDGRGLTADPHAPRIPSACATATPSKSGLTLTRLPPLGAGQFGTQGVRGETSPALGLMVVL